MHKFFMASLGTPLVTGFRSWQSVRKLAQHLASSNDVTTATLQKQTSYSGDKIKMGHKFNMRLEFNMAMESTQVNYLMTVQSDVVILCFDPSGPCLWSIFAAADRPAHDGRPNVPGAKQFMIYFRIIMYTFIVMVVHT